MHEDTRWKLIMGTALVTLTLALMTLHYLIFQDTYHLFIYFLGDLVFVPIEVLVVTLVLDQMIESRERQRRLEKLNMVIGTFFSKVGTPLLATFARNDSLSGAGREGLLIRETWQARDFAGARTRIAGCTVSVSLDTPALERLREFLTGTEDFLLMLVENPMVFEHESFTDLIFAVNHLTEELKARDDLALLPYEDRAHLDGDIRRAYMQLVPEWLRYMEYLHAHYPYLYSLALRKNPFDPSASAVIRG